MHVLILALCTWIIQTEFAYYFFWAKSLSHSFDRTILRKKERGRKPSCHPIFCYLKKQIELLVLRALLLVKHIYNLRINLRNELLYSYFFYYVYSPPPPRQHLKNFYSRVLWYAQSDCVIFVKIPWLLEGVFPLFSKIRRIFSGS